jgi:hypothetical protein
MLEGFMRRMAMILGALAFAAAACTTSADGSLEGDADWWAWVNQQWPEVDGQPTDPGDPPGPPNGELWIEGDSLSSPYPIINPVTPWPERVSTANTRFAVGGSTLNHILARLQYHLPAYGTPDNLVIMAGINDIVAQGNSLAALIADLEAIETAAGDVPVTWITITPLTYNSTVRTAWNDWLRNNRPVIDCGDALGSLLGPPYAWGDDVHLNAAGHDALAACIDPYLAAL